MPYKVVVIGRNYTSRLGMIRAVGIAGYDVIVIKTNGSHDSKDIDAYSKYVKKYLYAKEPNREELISVIQTLKSDDKTIIIPVDDFAASTIDENIDLLKKDFFFPNINMKQGAVNRLMDKNFQKELAEKSGLKVAKGWTVNIQDHSYILPPDIVYPVFPKPQVSFKGNKRCMRRCNDEAELRMVLDEVARKKDCPMLIEQYCEITKEYALLGVSNGVDVIIPGIIHMLKSGSGPHRGVTLQGKVLPINNYMSFVNQLYKFIRELHFCGLFDVDVYESNGLLYFNELNLRFGASGYAITSSGVNLPLFFIDYIRGKEWMDAELKEKVSVFVNEKVANDDYKNGYISRNEYDKLVSQADIRFLKSGEDNRPYEFFLSRNFSVKRKLKKIIGLLGKYLKL